MKKSFFTLVISIALVLPAYSQVTNTRDQLPEQAKTFSLTKKTGKIKIDLGSALIEGYSGNEIIFSSVGKVAKEDERAKGLRVINGLGLEDNTGLGINVSEVNGEVEVSQLNKTDPPTIKILVPNGVLIAFDHQSPFGKKIIFKNVQSEIEVSTQHNSINLENVTGPAIVKTLHGNVDAIFSQNLKGPISIVSIHGHVDITIPQSVKADLKLSTKYGELLTSPDLKIDIQKEGEMIRYNNQVNGKINGGGTSIDLRSDHGKIYLRTK